MNRLFSPFCLFLLVAVVQAQNNLIKNGDFSDSTAVSWNFDANGANANGKVELGRYVITIESPGGRESAPQLSQRGIELQTGEGYTISFKVSASDTGHIRVSIDSEGSITFSDSLSGKIPLSTTLTAHAIDFFVQRARGTARLIFNCGLSSNLTKIALDSISILKKTTPIIRITAPDAESRWIAGTEREIQWQNSGVLEKVKIRFSVDSGTTWSTITEAASNRKSFWWKIPATTAGNNCRVIVSDTAGTNADTSALFRIVAPGTIDIEEMVKNGDFLDTTYWRLNVLSPAKARGSFTDDRYVIRIDTAGTEPWQVKLEQPGFTLENGTMYRFSFDAYASHDRTIFANVGSDNGNPAWSVYGGDTVPVNISTTTSRYTQTIIMKYPTSSNIRIEFNCGNDTGMVYIDNVSLLRMEAAYVFILNPSLGQILKSGSKFNIEWQAVEVPTVDLEYSLDSGETWTMILEEVDNLGLLTWTVPEQSSELCFIRIRNSADDSALGTSAQFQINKFGAAVKTGELIANGTFSNNQQNWKITSVDAVGQTDFSDKQFEIDIREPGDSLNAIVLSQAGLPVLKGKEYTLSFDVFANGDRSMGIALVADDTVRLLDTVVALPTAQHKLSFKFTPEADAIIRLDFLMGGARAGVFIDNVSFYTGPDPSTSGVLAAGYAKAHSDRFTVQPLGAGAVFHTPQDVGGTISIYNLQGMLLRTLQASGRTLFWDGKTCRGVSVARGSYIAALSGRKTRAAARFIIR
ncbi:MAG: carbohydrate binding domain-containing protein [Chitinispirillaceae bacterium]|nr:carbohydrate binding domain-containing protein [Chitinispirillaceae bacterium]